MSEHSLHPPQDPDALPPRTPLFDQLTGGFRLPDGSGAMMVSTPLAADHWLYTKFEEGRPTPILSDAQRVEVIAAGRYAIRAATFNGRDNDFDPDALIQNLVVALCGEYPLNVNWDLTRTEEPLPHRQV